MESAVVRKSVGTQLKEGLDALKAWGEVVEWGTEIRDGRLSYRIVFAGINAGERHYFPGEALAVVSDFLEAIG